MKRFIFLFFFLFTLSLSAQSKIGLEVRSSVDRTYNQGAFVSNYYISGFEGYERSHVTREQNLNTLNYSIGLVWSFKQSNRVKLHLGSHRNGRIFDITEENSFINKQDYENYRIIYYYRQYHGSYSYVFTKNKFKFPLELGVALNQTLDEGGYRWFLIEGFNIDFITRVGLERELFNNFSVGFNLKYSHAICRYGIDESWQSQELDAIYIPYQFGLETSLNYNL